MEKCINCRYIKFEEYNGSSSRYYCLHPEAIKEVGSRMVCRCDRGSSEIKIKTSPKWCPLKQKCRICGCTWDNACPGSCWWVEKDLCSSCKAMGCS